MAIYGECRSMTMKETNKPTTSHTNQHPNFRAEVLHEKSPSIFRPHFCWVESVGVVLALSLHMKNNVCVVGVITARQIWDHHPFKTHTKPPQVPFRASRRTVNRNERCLQNAAVGKNVTRRNNHEQDNREDLANSSKLFFAVALLHTTREYWSDTATPINRL